MDLKLIIGSNGKVSGLLFLQEVKTKTNITKIAAILILMVKLLDVVQIKLFFCSFMIDNDIDFLHVKTPFDFEAVAMERFNFQFEHVLPYRKWCELLQKTPKEVKNSNQIPFFPVEFFKSHRVLANQFEAETTFFSSSTTQQKPSEHHIASLKWYDAALLACFERHFGSVKQYCIFGLLPAYLERNGASLVYMVNKLIELSGNSMGGFYLQHESALPQALEKAATNKLIPLVFGVSFALLNWAETNSKPLPPNTIIIETGGMKGRRKELTRDALHQLIKHGLSIDKHQIKSEYGMTEMLSQAYCDADGFYNFAPWVQVRLRETNDPFTFIEKIGKTGAINIIDLSNKFSCSFLATQDLGRFDSLFRFEVLGRFDDAEIRGCNLLVQ